MSETPSKKQTDLKNIRDDYSHSTLDKSHVDPNPITQLDAWVQQAIEAQCLEATAMTVATCGDDNQPDCRIVLLKGIDEGLIFYTNYNSKKGRDLAENTNAACQFFWPQLERQVRVQGQVEQLSHEASSTYFDSRPLGSRISAMVSPQSDTITSKQPLIDEMSALEKNPENVKCPPHWGGYRLNPTSFEFWQGRPSRFHDRVCYAQENQSWKIYQKAP